MLLAVTFFAACNDGGTSESNKDTTATTLTTDTTKMMTATKYTCTMHPEVISDTAGHCPKCRMKMVPIKDSTSSKQ